MINFFSLHLLSVLFFLAFLLFQPFSIAQSSEKEPESVSVTRIEPLEERAAVLKMIRSSIEENYISIKSWRGVFRFQDIQYLDVKSAKRFIEQIGGDARGINRPLTRKDDGKIEFSYEASTQRVFTSYELVKPSVFMIDNTGEVFYTASGVPKQKSLITPEHYLHLSPNLIYGQLKLSPGTLPRKGPVAAREDRELAKKQQYSMVMDPRALFDCGMPVVDYLSHMITALEQGEDVDGVLTTQEAEVARRFIQVSRVNKKTEGKEYLVYEVQIGPLPERNMPQTQNLTFSGNEAFNLVQVTDFRDDRLTSQMDWKYDNQSGSLVPKYFRKMSATEDSKYMAFERTMELMESTVNKPLPKSVFSYANLGMKDGDRLEDRIQGKVFVLEKGTLVEPKLDTLANAPLEKTFNGFFASSLFYINVVVILVIGSILGRRYLKKGCFGSS